MNIDERISLLQKLGAYINSDNDEWKAAKVRAGEKNPWFTLEFIDYACRAIAEDFLPGDILRSWLKEYFISGNLDLPKRVGLVMAGNIPLAGFHDLLCVFMSGNKAVIKLSSKDDVLLPHIIDKLISWDDRVAGILSQEPILKNCNAYIATGSNNSAGYFNYYFGKYPHIIRRNRVSVSILDGTETDADLQGLAQDVFLYFGLGCRNVSKLFVSKDYKFERLLTALSTYNELSQHHKFKNNYDYNLALLILNNKYYMSTEALLLVEDAALHSPLAQLNYAYYERGTDPLVEVDSEMLQGIIGHGHIPFGTAQRPTIDDYADGVDTMKFLLHLSD